VPQAGSSTVSPRRGSHDLHHEAHHRARRVELAGVARRVAHLAQHRLVQVREGVDLFAGAEVDAVDLVDDVAQQVAADHAVLHALEDVGDDLALAALFALAGQAPQVGEQPLAACCRRRAPWLLIDEGQQFVAGDAVLAGGPVAPAVRRLDDGLVGLAVEFGLFLVDDFQVVEELQEHHPGEQWQAVHVAIEPLSLRRILRAVPIRRTGSRAWSAGLGLARARGTSFRVWRCWLWRWNQGIRLSLVIGRAPSAAATRRPSGPSRRRSGGWRFRREP
jgi:hypothetical protein